MLRPIKRAGLAVLDRAVELLLSPRLRWEWRSHAYPPRNERPIEYGFALDWIVRTAPERVLDVGCGRSSWPHLLATCGLRTTAIDKVEGYWRGSLFNRHYHVVRDDVTAPGTRGPFDLITCLSVLEHVPDHAAAVAGMVSLLRPGGHLVLSFPYSENRFVEDVYRLPEASYGSDFPFIGRVYSRAQLDQWLADGRAELADERLWRAFTGELWTFGERLFPPEPATRDRPHQLGCFVLRRRA